MTDPLLQRWQRLRDWTYEHYYWAYALGTGFLCQDIFAPHQRLSLAAWLTCLGAGGLLEPCVNPRRQLYGKNLWHLPQERLGAALALTFDDGPGPETPALLDLLAERRVVANFFCVGQQIERYPEVVQRIAAEGHLLGNHSLSHPNLLVCGPAETRRQLERVQQRLLDLTGNLPSFWRPPFGFRAPWTQAVADRLQLKAALWSINPRDFQNPGADIIAQRVLQALEPGSIILLHDGFSGRQQTLEATRLILDQAQQQGYHWLRLDQALG